MLYLPPRELSWKICSRVRTRFSRFYPGAVVSKVFGRGLAYLVRGIQSTTANDTELGVETLGCKSVLADVLPPDCCRIVSILNERKTAVSVPFSTQASPKAWMPSAWFLPMMTLRMVDPGRRLKTASASVPSDQEQGGQLCYFKSDLARW